MTRQDTRRSKLLSLVLRHRPELIGITLDEAGWTNVVDLLEALRRYGEPLSKQDLETIVSTSDKQRFAFDATWSRIRANQGHSLPVDLGLAAVEPPAILFHGTARRFEKSIRRQGLLKGKRHHVHLHANPEAASISGKRHGECVVLSIDAGAMRRDGFRFYVTENHVWLTELVPPKYIRVCPGVPSGDDVLEIGGA